MRVLEEFAGKPVTTVTLAGPKTRRESSSKAAFMATDSTSIDDRRVATAIAEKLRCSQARTPTRFNSASLLSVEQAGRYLNRSLTLCAI